MITARRTLGFVAAAGGLVAMECAFRASPLYAPEDFFQQRRRNAAENEFRLDSGEGRKVPAVAFSLKDGTRRTLADYEGQGVVLNLWATWCPPCRAEMRSLDALASAVAWTGIVVLPVSTDAGGAPVVQKLYAEQNLAYLPVLLDPGGASTRGLWRRGLPTTLLIDKTGRERKRHVGPWAWDAPEVIAMVQQLAF